MQVAFGSHFTLSRPVSRPEFKEKFKTKGNSGPYRGIGQADTFDSILSIRDENDWKVEAFLQQKNIHFTKKSSLEHFNENPATQAQSCIDEYKDNIEKRPGVPSLMDIAARRFWAHAPEALFWDQLSPTSQEALIRNRPQN